MRQKRKAPCQPRRCPRKELAAASDLDPDTVAGADKVRLDHACWVALAIENLQSAILAGRRVEVGELERPTAALNALLPAPQTTLNVTFVGVEKEPGRLPRRRSDRITAHVAYWPTATFRAAPKFGGSWREADIQLLRL
jgi:hypothetical protein